MALEYLLIGRGLNRHLTPDVMSRKAVIMRPGATCMLQAWAIFRAFERHCRVDSGGYAGLESVLGEAPLQWRDHMESFWLSESLKYLWLLFSDDGAVVQLLDCLRRNFSSAVPVCLI